MFILTIAHSEIHRGNRVFETQIISFDNVKAYSLKRDEETLELHIMFKNLSLIYCYKYPFYYNDTYKIIGADNCLDLED